MAVRLHKIVPLAGALVWAFWIPSALAEDLLPAWKKLESLRGTAYAKGRDEFLERPGVEEFLNDRVAKTPEDWLAPAVLARAKQSPHVLAFDSAAVAFARRRKGQDVGPLDAFDERAFWSYPRQNAPGRIPLSDPIANQIPQRNPTDGIEALMPLFDWMLEMSLELEWSTMNPQGLAANHRGGMLFRRLYIEFAPLEGGMPTALASLESSRKPYAKKSLASFDAKRFDGWLAGLRDGQVEEFVRLSAALCRPGPESNRTLQTLARQDTLIGPMAALVYAARTDARRPEPAFQSEWLEDWIQRASRQQLKGVETIFLGKEGDLNSTALAIPPIVAGLFLKHHADDLAPALKQVYSKAVSDSLEEFLNVANSYNPQDDPGGYALETLTRDFPASVLWPKTAENKLATVTSKDKRILEYVTRAKANLGQRAYPTTEDLQAMFKPARP